MSAITADTPPEGLISSVGSALFSVRHLDAPLGLVESPQVRHQGLPGLQLPLDAEGLGKHGGIACLLTANDTRESIMSELSPPHAEGGQP